ncbi:DUF4199 domain-containing protein [Myroides sp. LJL115]
MKDPINKIGIKFGLILAAYYTLFDCIVFFTDQNLFTNIPLGFLNIFVTIALAIGCILMAKKQIGGYITFKEAFTPYLLYVLIGVTVNMVVYYILFNFVNPNAQEPLRDTLYQMAIDKINALGMPEADRLAKIKQAEESNPFTFQTQVFAWAGSILKYCILGFLLAAIFRNKSEFTPVEKSTQDSTGKHTNDLQAKDLSEDNQSSVSKKQPKKNKEQPSKK